MFKQLAILAVPTAITLLTTVSPLLANDIDEIQFRFVISAGAKTCLANASATGRISAAGHNQHLDVYVKGLPPTRLSRCL
jgi:hypothetical protein